MPASTDIYGQIQQPKPVNRLADMAQMMQVQGLQQDQQLGRLKADEYQRGLGETNTLNAAFSGSLGADGKIDRNKLFSLMAEGNLGAKIPGLQTGFAKQDSEATTADAAKFKLAKDRHDLFKQTMGALSQEPNLSKDLVLQAGQSLVQQGLLPAELYEKAMATMPDDPQQLRARLTQGLKSQMTAQQILKVFSPNPTEVNNGQTKSFRDTNPNSPTYGQTTAGAPVQMLMTPGETAADRRAAAVLAETKRHHGATEKAASDTKEEGKWQYDADRGGRVNVKTGEFQPVTQGGVPVGPKDKALTEGQAKANLFGTRMQESNKVLESMAKVGVIRPGGTKALAETVGNIVGLGTESMGGALSDAAGSLTNWTQSDEQQQVEQGQRDFINAALRRESGASIAPHEFRNANKQYFPQANDGADVLAQKARNRQLATDAMLEEVPEHKRTKPRAVAPKDAWEAGKERRYQEWKAGQGK